jgi:phosphoserine phosphatase
MGFATGTQAAKATSTVLCVDLDGTLIRSDLLWECILALFKTRPATLFLVPFWLLRGRAFLKRELARRVQLDPARLPYRQEVLAFLQQQKLAERRIALVTAADQNVAEPIAQHLGLFDEVHASNGERNLRGEIKATFLKERFAISGFEYVGDSVDDLSVWRYASAAYVVGSPARAAQAEALTTVKATFTDSPASLRTWISALRGHHWAKNLLLFLPLALSHNLAIEPVARTIAGFVLYGFCASGLYILNDLLDLHSDREHPWKKERPFAAGQLSIPGGMLVAFTLLSLAVGLGCLFDIRFGLALIAYAALTMFYSLCLKKIALHLCPSGFWPSPYSSF